MLVIEITIILLLIVLNGILALSELAVVSSRRSRLESMAGRGDHGARAALGLFDDPSRFLSTVQIGITLIGIVAGAFGGTTIAGTLAETLDTVPWIAPNGGPIAITIVVVIVTYASLLVGELVPKRIALANPERTAARIATPMRLLSRIAAPAVWLLRHSSDAILRLIGFAGSPRRTITEDEVRSLIAEGTRAGVFAPQEREMIDGVLRLADRSVRGVMTPRTEVVWIDAAASWTTILETIGGTRHERLLVCDGSIDQAVGSVAVRDLFLATLGERPIDLASVTRPALAVSENAAVLTLLDIFRREGMRFAVIVDEYGTTQGIVTATDVLESIAGDLPERGEPVEPMIIHRADGSWLIDGRLPIDEFETLTGIRGLAAGGDFETLAGFAVAELGRLPVAGDRVVRPDMTIEVVDMDGRRVDKLAVWRT